MLNKLEAVIRGKLLESRFAAMVPGSIYSKLTKVEGVLYFYAGFYLKRSTPIIVYQTGKVGSASVTASLMSSQGNYVFHVHWMNPENLKRQRAELLEKNLRLPAHLALAERVYKNIVRRHKKAKFISLVREPISICISAFFQNFRRYTGIEYGDANFTIGELVDIFLKNYRHSVPLTWFDVEMKEVLDIDVYEYPFPKEKGHLSISKGNFDLLILKSEIDDSTTENAIAGYLGIDNFKLTRTNVAQNKNYAKTYQDFVQNVRLPESYIETMCNSKYMRHFYSDAEIERIRSRWNKTSRVGKTR
jgi:hypothetical protein